MTETTYQRLYKRLAERAEGNKKDAMRRLALGIIRKQRGNPIVGVTNVKGERREMTASALAPRAEPYHGDIKPGGSAEWDGQTVVVGRVYGKDCGLWFSKQAPPVGTVLLLGGREFRVRQSYQTVAVARPTRGRAVHQ